MEASGIIKRLDVVVLLVVLKVALVVLKVALVMMTETTVSLAVAAVAASSVRGIKGGQMW